MIIGPPGTGKTDVAVQIITNVYKQSPKSQILLITRSNQALNHIFQKISESNIDPLHLLRLGHGHEDMLSLESWGKTGRINSFLEKRTQLLNEATKLAVSLDYPVDHTTTCESSEYFYSNYILPLWNQYKTAFLNIPDKDVTEIRQNFPFRVFSRSIQSNELDKCDTVEEAKHAISAIFNYIENLFSQISQVRPFELLRTNKDRSNYLLVKEARIVAMTSTHASIKRRELVRLGFKYDTVIMEESGQMLEIETFIPFVLQSHDTDLNRSPLSRIVLIGDHNQLPPIVQNQAVSKYGKMEQSLFARLIRLGVPTISLDAQGRSRPSIADLFRWKYSGLKDLAISAPEFKLMNAGFQFEYQAIDVPDYKGVGESFPRPHFVQNLGEAEYVVATYMYMRLLGYIIINLVIPQAKLLY